VDYSVSTFSHNSDSMFSASRNVFQRVSRMAMRSGVSQMNMATTASKTYNKCSLFAVGMSEN